jgi:hypothetical protein
MASKRTSLAAGPACIALALSMLTCSPDADSCLVGTEQCLCSVGGGCERGLECDGGFCVPLGAEGSGPTWTIFVYGHGDHNLANLLLDDLQEMARSRLSRGVNLIVLTDWNATDTIGDSNERFPTGAFWYRIDGNGRAPRVVARDPELDFDDPTILSQAMALAFARFPADRYGLILWDHGGAWSGGFGGDSQDGSRSREQLKPLPVETLAAAVKQGLKVAGLQGQPPLEFISFDTCLMSGPEIIAPFQDVAKVFISNAEIDYGAGWDYDATLTWLSRNRGASAAELAAAEAGLWDAHHRVQGLNDQLLRSHAAFDTSKVAALGPAIRDLVGAVRSEGGAVDVARGMFRSDPPYSKFVDASGTLADLRDLGDVLSSLKGSTRSGVARAASRALDTISSARLAHSYGSLREKQSGLHIFAGPIKSLGKGLSTYPSLARTWNQASDWSSFIGLLQDAADDVDPKVTATAALPPNPTQQNPPKVNFKVEGGDVVYAKAMVAMDLVPEKPGSRWLVLGEAIANYTDDHADFTMSWFAKVIGIQIGNQYVVTTALPWVRASEIGEYHFPIGAADGVFSSPGGETYPATVLIDMTTKRATHALIRAGGLLSVRSIQDLYEESRGGLTFVPTLSVIDVDEDEPLRLPAEATVSVTDGSGIQFVEAPLQAGSYWIIIFAYDAWGNSGLDGVRIPLDRPVQ